MLGYLSAIVAALVWSLSPVIIASYAKDARSIPYNALRVVTSTPILVVIALLSPYGLHIELNWIAMALFVAASLLGPGLGDVAYIRAIQMIGSSRAVIIGYTYIFIAQVISIVLLGEKLTVSLALGSALAFIGIVIAIHSSEDDVDRHRGLGIVYAVIASIAWGIGSVVNKLALNYADPLSLAVVRMVILSLVMVSVCLRDIPQTVKVRRWLLSAIASGVLAYSVGIPLFLYALNTIGVSITVLATAITPVLTTAFSRYIAKEKIGFNTLSGAILTALGIAIAML